MPRKIIYVTEYNPEFYKKGSRRSKDIIFYFPKNEMDILKNQSRSAFYLDYRIDDNHYNDEKEFELQEEILETDDSKNYFILIKKEYFEKVKKFIHSDIAKEDDAEIDVIFLKLGDDFTPPEDDLFVFTSTGNIFPLQVGSENYFKRKKNISINFSVQTPLLN